MEQEEEEERGGGPHLEPINASSDSLRWDLRLFGHLIVLNSYEIVSMCRFSLAKNKDETITFIGFNVSSTG